MVPVHSHPAISEIKQRLTRLGMIDLGESIIQPVPQTVVNSDITSPEQAESTVRAKILEALNRTSRADAVVPTSGKPEILRAVFIKSNSEDIGAKLAIIEEASDSPIVETIQKTAPLNNPLEASSITVGIASPIFQLAPPGGEVKSPQGVRKFHSWLSYFYSGHGKTSGSSSPSISDSPASPKTTELGELEGRPPPVNELVLLLKRKPTKSILKIPKGLNDLSNIPAPVQKMAFLRQEEVHRLTKFTEKFRNRRPDQPFEDHLEMDEFTRGKSGFARRRRVRFDFERTSMHETYSRSEYDRAGVEYIAKSLTPEVAMMIKRELNEVKREMPIHEDSKMHTQFYVLR